MVRGITDQDRGTRNIKLQHTLSHWMAQPNMRILELESRCAVIRTVGSNPTLSANYASK